MRTSNNTSPRALSFVLPGALCRRWRWRSCATLSRADNVTIRAARPTDALALATLVSEAFRPAHTDENRARVAIRTLVRYVERGDLAAQFAARSPSVPRPTRRHSLLLAEEDSEIVGCVEVGILPSPASIAEGDVARVWSDLESVDTRIATPYIGNLAVSPARQRRGLGDRLVAAAENEARVWGADKVALHVDKRNVAAQKLYRRRGYECRVIEPSWYPAVGRLQRMFLAKELAITTKMGNGRDDWAKAPVVHTRPLSPWEYIRWCVYDLRKRDMK